jgi:rare lipoprotein A
MKDQHVLIFGALFFTAVSIPLSFGHLNSVSDVPKASSTKMMTNGDNHYSPALEFADEIIDVQTSLVLHRKMNAVGTGVTIIGVASTYNPFRPGRQEGGKETASGELYDPVEWTAAIHTDLREKFGGVSYGRLYRHSYALVEGVDKKVIVKINDVGPLRPGRVIDFNEQTMRYFDPTLKLGLIHGVMVTPLLGDDWPTGPIE